MNKLTITTIAFMAFVKVAANEYDLGSRKINLPLSASLKANSPSKDSLVFFDKSRSQPRPIISIYLASFKYPGDNVSEFEKTSIRTKLEWYKENEATEISAPSFKYLKSDLAVISQVSFEFQSLKFTEIVKYQDCDDGTAIVTKAMIPLEQKQSQLDIKQFEPILNKNLCLKTSE